MTGIRLPPRPRQIINGYQTFRDGQTPNGIYNY